MHGSEVSRRGDLQLARTCVRRALTCIRSAISSWKDSSISGRTALNSLSNTHLRQLHLAQLDCGKMRNVPSIREGASRALRYKLFDEIEALMDAVHVLEGAVVKMREALGAVKARAGATPSVADVPVFSCLALQQVHAHLENIVSGYTAQLPV
jgi:hypothetical protein